MGKVSKAQEARSNVAIKIMSGDKLTLAEFTLAVKSEMFDKVDKNNPEEIAQAYQVWLGQYYRDDKRHGSLCGRSATRITSKTPDGGGTICAWGIHMEDVKPEYLTPENIKFLVDHFGADTVKAITGK